MFRKPEDMYSLISLGCSPLERLEVWPEDGPQYARSKAQACGKQPPPTGICISLAASVSAAFVAMCFRFCIVCLVIESEINLGDDEPGIGIYLGCFLRFSAPSGVEPQKVSLPAPTLRSRAETATP